MCSLLSCPLILPHLGSFALGGGVPGTHSSDPLRLQLKDSRAPWKTPLTQRLWDKYVTLTRLLRGDALCSLGYSEGPS